MFSCPYPPNTLPSEAKPELNLAGGAAEVSDPLTRGTQCFIRNMTWKAFVRATRPTFLCANPKRKIMVILSYKVRTDSFAVEELNRSVFFFFGPEKCSPCCGMAQRQQCLRSEEPQVAGCYFRCSDVSGHPSKTLPGLPEVCAMMCLCPGARTARERDATPKRDRKK